MRLLAALIKNWPIKLGALLLALVAWYFVKLGDDTVGQNTLFVPVIVEGLTEEQIPIGVPETVTVVVSGRSTRVSRLRPETFAASLDLTEADGPFSQDVQVVAPPGVEILSVTPAEATGTVETITSKNVPVQVALLGTAERDLQLELSFDPQEVSVGGRGTTLARVTAVRATTLPVPGDYEAPLYPIDDAGRPVPDITVRPPTVRVNLGATPVLHQKTLALQVLAPAVRPLVVEALEPQQAELLVAGPPERLAELAATTATVQEPTGGWSAGEYTLEVRADLPEGVTALSTPTVLLRLSAPAGGEGGGAQSAGPESDGPESDGSESDGPESDGEQQ